MHDERGRRRRNWAICGLVLAGMGGRAEAMTYRPISDENLVAASALVVVADVEATRGARLDDGRIVTQSELQIVTGLKGGVAGGRIRVTEPGGRVGDVTVRIPGVPQFAAGERTLVFLRERADGTLGTTALALAKYTVTTGARPRARRLEPTVDDRALDDFAARVRALAGAGARRAVSDGFAGAAAVEVDLRVDGFTLLGSGGDCDPVSTAGCVGGRWFEARCGETLVYSPSGSDGGVGASESRAAFDAAIGAWSSAAGGRLDIAAGPDWPTVPSSLAPVSFADLDGVNVVQFEDPFDIVPDLSGCQGILALGGTVSTSSERLVEGDTTYDRVLEGDVVVNPGVGACLGADGLAETLAHEVGHSLGFGHSSENPSEPDPDLADALMYFLVHDDGRGAVLRTDDLAGLAFVYGPPPAEATPAGAALRDAACLAGIGLWSSACFVDQEAQGGLPAAAFKKAAKGGKLAGKAYRTTKPKKQVKFLGNADRQLAKAEIKVNDLAVRGTLGTACAEALLDDLGRGRAKLAEARAAIEAVP